MPRKNQFKPGPEPGTVFGYLTVVGKGSPITERSHQVPTSKCICKCGKEITIRNYVLTRKAKPAQSCGCVRVHGCANRDKSDRTYRAWADMKTRCKRHSNYKDVRVCERWLKSFLNFKEDMGECPPGLTLDRINVLGDYEPTNCRWVDMVVQANNRTNNRRITVEGTTKTVQEWMKFHGLDSTTFYRRLKLGWTVEEAAGTPKRGRRRNST